MAPRKVPHEAEVPRGDGPRVEDQLCFAIYQAGHAFTRAYRPVLGELGLTYPQYLVMLVLWEADGVTVKALGERLSLDSGTLTPLLKRLEGMGLVRRQRSRHDERQVLLHLTESGEALRVKGSCVPERMVPALGLKPAGIAAMVGQLQALGAALRTGNGE